MIRKILCMLGLHEYYGDSDYFVGCANNKEVTIMWYQCRKCNHCKLKMITH